MILQVWFCALAGYTFAKLRFRGRDALFVGILATMMIPLGVGLIPNFIIMARIGWVDTYRALIVPGIANAFGIFWMRQYCLSCRTNSSTLPASTGPASSASSRASCCP